jgi:hypothetical protein
MRITRPIGLLGVLLCALCVFVVNPSVRADEIQEKYRASISKGLDWLATKQLDKGYWSATPNGDTYPVSMTALAGMAFLMEGSTVREGKYAEQIRKAVDYLMDKSQAGGNRDGLIGDPAIPNESVRYMYGHGFGMLFLSCVYGDEQDKKKRERLRDILTRAVKYSIAAQSSRGGWYYTSKADGHDQDEGSVTITQVQALRAADNAGIKVPKAVITKTYDYLKSCTGPRGGVYYSFQVKQEKPAITAAGVACLFNAGEYKDELAKKWLTYCRENIRFQLNAGGGPHIGQEEYTHYYFGQCLYVLGDKGWAKLFPGAPESEIVTWSKYRDTVCDQLIKSQNQDGSWTGGGVGVFNVGQVYTTSMWLALMQLDKGALPIYQR